MADNFETLQAQRRLMERRAAEAIADRVVAALFVNAFDERGERLALKSAGERDLGGWGKPAVRSMVILAVLGPDHGEEVSRG